MCWACGYARYVHVSQTHMSQAHMSETHMCETHMSRDMSSIHTYLRVCVHACACACVYVCVCVCVLVGGLMRWQLLNYSIPYTLDVCLGGGRVADYLRLLDESIAYTLHFMDDMLVCMSHMFNGRCVGIHESVCWYTCTICCYTSLSSILLSICRCTCQPAMPLVNKRHATCAVAHVL